jgi:ribokinase
MKSRIVVVGSLHMDLTVRANSIPRIGETVLGSEFKMAPGGKGANQAVAAAKLGASVTMVGRVGTDSFGEELIKNAINHAINTDFIVADPKANTGLALIMVDRKGENIIAVAPGADFECVREDIDRADSALKSADVLLTQLETPLTFVHYAIDRAFSYGVKVILNPAPAQKLPNGLFKKVHILVPNEHEAEVLTGIRIENLKSAKMSVDLLMKKGAENVALTMGKRGTVVGTKERKTHVGVPRVSPVDTTGAGDAFCGALAVGISAGKELTEAVFYANCAGALKTTKMGAQEALPTREKLEDFIRQNPLFDS